MRGGEKKEKESVRERKMDSKEERKGNLIKQGEEQNCPEKEKEKKRVT